MPGRNDPDPRLKPYNEPAEVTVTRNINRLLDLWRAKDPKHNTYAEIRRMTGISQTAFLYYRRGERTPSLAVITKLAAAMGVPSEMFFRR